MNIEHLRYVLEVDRAGSISRAADNLHMGQPNLSKAVKELEQALNIQIFARTSKGVNITAKGREFLVYAKTILQQYEELEALGQDQTSDDQSLRVSVPRASYIVEAFTTMLASLDLTRPLHMNLVETNALRAITHVEGGSSGFGIIRCMAEYQNYFTSLITDRGLTYRTLLSGEYHLLMSQSHPLAARELIDFGELRPFIEIIHGDTAMPNMPENATETESGVTPGDKKIQVYERGSQFDILTRVPGTYMWVSPMPADLLTRNQLVQKPCAQSPRFSDLLVYQSGYAFSDLETKLISLLVEAAADIQKTKKT